MFFYRMTAVYAAVSFLTKAKKVNGIFQKSKEDLRWFSLASTAEQ